ncbi:MAG: DUF454 family protein [Isosphaeraceae bacterium]
MKPDPNEMPPPPQATGEESHEWDNGCRQIELDEQAGLGRAVDARLFQPARREYAQRLLKALCEHPGVRKAQIDLASSTCRVEFDLASSTPAFMGGILAEAIRTTSARAAKSRWWRRSPRWSTLTAYRSFGDLSLWETLVDEQGSVRLVHRGHARNRAVASRLADSLADLEGVERCHVSLWSHRITIDCCPGAGPSATHTVDRVERILEGRRAADPTEAVVRSGVVPAAADAPVIAATAWKRLRYKAMAGGAFTLTLVGLVVPGVPTVPFLLATSYYLARSSPRLNERLRRTAFFGPILQEWEGHGALSLASKGKLIGVTATIVVVTVVLAPLTPLALSVILLMSSLSVYGVARMPGLAEDAQTDVSVGGRTVLPLPAP